MSNGIAGAERKVALSSLLSCRQEEDPYTSCPYTLIVIEDIAPGYDAYRTSLIVLISGPDNRGARA